MASRSASRIIEGVPQDAGGEEGGEEEEKGELLGLFDCLRTFSVILGEEKRGGVGWELLLEEFPFAFPFLGSSVSSGPSSSSPSSSLLGKGGEEVFAWLCFVNLLRFLGDIMSKRLGFFLFLFLFFLSLPFLTLFFFEDDLICNILKEGVMNLSLSLNSRLILWLELMAMASLSVSFFSIFSYFLSSISLIFLL